MNRTRLPFETILYAAAFLLALLLRLVGAGQIPLDNREAGLALQALALSRGEDVLVDPQPLYLALTGLWFFFFGAGEWSARFFPALAGGALALVPVLYRQRIGRWPAVLLAFFLALDPALLAVSRQVGGQGLAMLLLMLSIGLWLQRRAVSGGVVVGFALLSGPFLWPGLVGLAAAVWISGERQWVDITEDTPGFDWRRFLLAAGATLFFAGTVFFAIPRGLSAAAGSLPAYFQGWFSTGTVPLLQLVLGLLFYEFFPLILGLWGGVRGLVRGDRFDRFLFIWWAVALLLALVYPGRQVSDLAWSLLPLWALAARQVARQFRLPAYDRLSMAGQALLTAVILAFVSLTLASISNNYNVERLPEYLFRTLGSLGILLASTGLIAWGWSQNVALKGLIWGFLVVLGVYSLAAGWHAAGFAGQAVYGDMSRELWSSGPVPAGNDLLLKTIQDFDRWSEGEPEVLVMGMDEPALRWALRDTPNVSFVSLLSDSNNPGVVITPVQPELALQEAYRGQELVLSWRTHWDRVPLTAWWRWLVYRTLPDEVVERQPVIVWGRTDLFPGGAQPVGQESVSP